MVAGHGGLRASGLIDSSTSQGHSQGQASETERLPVGVAYGRAQG